MDIRLKRVYEAAGPEDGARVLVDRLWPRGVSREAAGIDLWLREIAPSNELRKWFGHDPARWDEFRRRYFRELEGRPGEVEKLRQMAREGRLTLVYGALDAERNNAAAVREYLGSAGKRS